MFLSKILVHLMEQTLVTLHFQQQVIKWFLTATQVCWKFMIIIDVPEY